MMEFRCASVLLFLLHMSIASATLVIYHGRIMVGFSVVVARIEGVVALDNAVNHFFDCYKQGNAAGAASLEWRNNGVKVSQSFTATENVLYDGSDTDVKRFNIGVAGQEVTYTCHDTGDNETLSIKAMEGAVAICAAEPSTLECATGNLAQQVILGNAAVLQVYTDGDPSADPPTIAWSPLNTNRSSLQNGNRRLVIPSVTLEESGVYQIEVMQVIRGSVETAMTTISLDVHVGVATLSSPVSTPALEHASVTLTCKFTGNPKPTITWEREGPDNLPAVTRMSITSVPVRNESITLYTVTSLFTIQNVLYEDQGRYRCIASNTLTGGVQRSDTSAFAELTVTPRLQLTAQAPNTLDENGLVSVSDGSYVEIQCSGSGDLTWESSSGAAIMETNLVTPSFNKYQTHDPTNNVQNLIIQSFSPADIALYTCRTDLVVNGMISFAESVYISSSDPVIYIPEETVYAPEGSAAQIRATVYSSNLNILVVEWYHEGSLLNPGSDTRYSVSVQGMTQHTLTIARVEAGLLGMYQAVVTVGERNRSDTVQLAFPDPPTASVEPTSYSVAEDESASFRCQAGGTQPTVVWSLLGNLPLPSGVVQTGSDLVIARANQAHAGQYACTVTNSAGTVTSTAILTVYYAPVAIITRDGSTETSFNQVLQVVAEDGDSAPTFACSADGSPTPTLSWGGQNGGMALPGGVSLVHSRQNLALVWGRALEFTDSGSYMCNATNTAGTMSVRLELLVRRE